MYSRKGVRPNVRPSALTSRRPVCPAADDDFEIWLKC